MPDWDYLTNEIKRNKNIYDNLRLKYLKELFSVTGRNIIIYYSAWLQKPTDNAKVVYLLSINDTDKAAFMNAIHGMDRTKGLDLILHTPGGDIAATESLVDYLRNVFGNDVRAIIPQLALSAGCMIALSCKNIVMGKQSSLGPIDPQLNGISAHGAIEEFREAFKVIKNDPSTIPLWRTRIAQYEPAFIGECEKAIKWSEEVVRSWLRTGMFLNESGNNARAVDRIIRRVIRELGDHALTKSHSRHIPMHKCKEIGLKIESRKMFLNCRTQYSLCII